MGLPVTVRKPVSGRKQLCLHHSYLPFSSSNSGTALLKWAHATGNGRESHNSLRSACQGAVKQWFLQPRVRFKAVTSKKCNMPHIHRYTELSASLHGVHQFCLGCQVKAVACIERRKVTVSRVPVVSVTAFFLLNKDSLI